jgi:DcaP outer membrane protein
MRPVGRLRSSTASPIGRALCAVALVGAWSAPQALAQARPDLASPPAQVEALRSSIDDLRKLVDQQRVLIEQQNARLATQDRAIDELRRRLDSTSTMALAASNAVADLKQRTPAATVSEAVEQRLTTIEQSVQRVPEMPSEAVSAGEFPGSIRVPGTDANLKLGGQVRMTLVHSLRPLGVDDRFITSSIPVEGTQTAGEEKRTAYTAEPSKFNMDLRTPSRVGDLRTFLEWDFANDRNGARLRHAYMQSSRWLVGQTWSTFSDPEAEPVGIDFEGLNAISMLRQTQIRFRRRLRPNLGLAVSLENPAPSLTGAEGVNLTPDFVARVRWESETGLPGAIGRTQHVQVAVLARTLRGQVTDRPESTYSTGGLGGNVSGIVAPRWDPDDRVKFASNFGWGIGRYITDLGTLGGQDAIYDPVANELRALPVSSGYIGYERAWAARFSSSATYGIVNVANLDIQPGDALRRTQRTSFNVTFLPTPQIDMVVEFLAGTRVNKDGKRGSSSQIQAGWTFRF